MENMQKEPMKKEERGITLIALIITIIVLLILAGVSIAMLTGENGILNKAQSVSLTQAQAELEETISLALGESYMYLDGENDVATVLGLAENNGYISDDTHIITIVETNTVVTIGNIPAATTEATVEEKSTGAKVSVSENSNGNVEVTIVDAEEDEGEDTNTNTNTNNNNVIVDGWGDETVIL